MRFSDVIGQDEAKSKLLKMYHSGRVPHALLISAPEGFGGLPLAVAFAQLLNCEQPAAQDSCGECSACYKSSRLIHPDVFFSFPAVPLKSGDKPVSADFLKEWRSAFLQNPYLTYSQWMEQIADDNKQGNITVAECHHIIRQISLKNHEGRFKIQIIWLAEMLREAGNVLLKSIEEPPDNTVFILVTEQPELILNTILSRTQMLRLPPIQADALEQALSRKLGPDRLQEARRLAYLCGGSWSEALELLNDEDNEIEKFFLHWLRHSLGSYNPSNVAEIVRCAEQFQELGRERQKLFVRFGLFFLQNCLQLKATSQCALLNQALDAAQKLCARYDTGFIENATHLLNNLHYQIERNANSKIALHSTSIKIKQSTLQKNVEYNSVIREMVCCMNNG
ncbi:MAG: hypothetical protein RMJ53_09740 [Chitinophagales bacterium]|nr:hypothetical protein [Chitinophagales bacterium]